MICAEDFWEGVEERHMGKENVTYILLCADHTYYTGWTNDMERRLEAHNSKKGAKYTRGRTPVELVYIESFPTKEEAMKREAEIKNLSRQEKEKLIENESNKEIVKERFKK